MKTVSNEKLLKTIGQSHVWTVTSTLLMLFCTLVFALYMWTWAAFGAVMFAVLSVFWLVLKQTSAIRLENRR